MDTKEVNRRMNEIDSRYAKELKVAERLYNESVQRINAQHDKERLKLLKKFTTIAEANSRD